MGLFSKILGGSGADKSPLDLLKNAAQAVLDEAEKAAENAKKPAESAARPPRDAWGEPYGDSWGAQMPAEECQYNFPGSYLQYFDTVLRQEFPGYMVRQEPGKDSRSPLFVFYRDGAKRLVVELKSERSSAQAIRRRCEAEGVPYLRFYYDHDGWWNTRSYVTNRVKRALNG